MQSIPWFVAGPLMGVVVLLTYALLNKPLGALGSYAQVSDFLRRRPVKEKWRVWYLAGVCLGAVCAALVFGVPAETIGYGKLGAILEDRYLVPMLLLGGGCVGYGARWMGGCTSGHGLCGTSSRSQGSAAATGTFMATAIAVTFLIHWITGGAL